MNDLNISLQSDIKVILNSDIEIQGDLVFDVIGIYKHFVKYKLIGFSKPQFFLCDFRKPSLQAIRKCRKNPQFDEFYDQFKKPALLCIRQLHDKNIMVELRNPDENNPKYVLWIATGIQEEEIPNFCFIVKEVAPLKKEKKALLSICVRSQD